MIGDTIRRFTGRAARHALVLLVPVMMAGCTSAGPGKLFRNLGGESFPKEATPRPGQEAWINEVEVDEIVRNLTPLVSDPVRRGIALTRFRDLIQYTFRMASIDGSDVDGGLRALNFIKQRHFEAGGTEETWERVITYSKGNALGNKIPMKYK